VAILVQLRDLGRATVKEDLIHHLAMIYLNAPLHWITFYPKTVRDLRYAITIVDTASTRDEALEEGASDAEIQNSAQVYGLLIRTATGFGVKSYERVGVFQIS
jgi:hypothetical protein